MTLNFLFESLNFNPSHHPQKFSFHINDDEIKKIMQKSAAQTSSLFMTLRMWCDLGEAKKNYKKEKLKFMSLQLFPFPAQTYG